MPIGSLITSAARPSYGVGPALTITSAAPLATATAHSDAAGSTVSVEPIARNRPHRCAAPAPPAPPAQRPRHPAAAQTGPSRTPGPPRTGGTADPPLPPRSGTARLPSAN